MPESLVDGLGPARFFHTVIDGTPVVDIKPYLSNVPEERLRRGWLAEAEARKARSAATGF